MKHHVLACMLAIVLLATSQACATTLTFDDIPQGVGLEYYSYQYGIGFDSGFHAADHTGSTWGPPHSGSNVLAWSFDGWSNAYGMMFKNGSGPLYASSVGGYFSTEAGVVLEMIGYHSNLESPVGSAFIGAPGESWTNVHVEINSALGIGFMEFRPVTTEALSHFCADDVTVTFVPEPSAFLALGMGGLGILGMALRKRRR